MNVFLNKIKNKIQNVLNIDIGRLYPRPSTLFVKKNNIEKKELIAAEIGTFCGANALSILKTLPIKKIYLIDPYLKYEKFEDYKNKDSLEPSFEIAKRRLNKFKDKVIFIKKRSDEAINDIPDNIDFIYIDGNHNYEFVKNDMKIFYKKIKNGGVLAGHDINNGPDGANSGVIRAFIEFIKDKKNYFIQSPDWWIVKNE